MEDDIVAQLSNIKSMTRETALIMIDYYIADNAPKVGLGDEYFRPAPDDNYHDDNPNQPMTQSSINMRSKRYCAEQFIDGLLVMLRDIGASPDIINSYLEKISNNPNMPDHVVDAAIKSQDELIEETPVLRERLANLQQEYSHLIGPKLS